MTTRELDLMLVDWMDAVEPVSEPPALLSSVFATTRGLGQRRGLVGRMQMNLSSGGAGVAWNARPLLTYAIVILLLLAMTFAFAFAAGFLETPRFPTGWRTLDDYNSVLGIRGTVIADIASTEIGFVAVGSTEVSDQNCPGAATGRVWTSPDGDRWDDRSSSAPAAFSPQLVVSSGGWVYAFGNEITCADFTEFVPSGGGFRSRDGVAWETLPISPTVFQFGNVPHIVDAGGTLVAVGIHQEPLPSGEFEVGAEESVVWTSTDGATWQEVANLGQEFWVGSVAADENVIVALGGLRSQPGNVMMRSEDGGRTWTAVDLPDGLPQSLFQVVAGNGRFVAAGDEAVITSTDGQTWTEATSDSTVVDEVNGLWALPEGFMVSHVHRQDGGLVQQCYAAGLTPAQPQPSGRDELIDEPTDAPTVGPVPTDRCESIPANGGTSISADGLEWKRGPDLPMPGNGGQPNRYLVAGLGDSLVAADDTHGASIWYSPLELFLTSD